MTDKTLSTRQIVEARLKGRYNAEARFKAFGIIMVVAAIIACAILLVSIFVQSSPAMTESRLNLEIALDAAKVDPAGKRNKEDIRAQGDFNAVVVDALVKRFPNAENDGGIDSLMEMVSSIGLNPFAIHVSEHPELIGKTTKAQFALNDDVDMFLKGGFGKFEISNLANLANAPSLDGNLEFATNNEGFKQTRARLLEIVGVNYNKNKTILEIKKQKIKSLEANPNKTPELEQEISQIQGDLAELENYVNNVGDAIKNQAGALPLADNLPSVILFAGNGAFKVNSLANDKVSATQIIAPNAALNTGKIVLIESSADTRPLNDTMAAYGILMKSEGMIKSRPNLTLLTRSDSNDAEMAGVLSAIIGSLLTLCVTFAVAVPIGVMAAIYLEEFAPKNWLTDLIEVNINNLAAVPSIVFGLLGFSVFLHFFQMPRSAPVVGGVVLSLMSLPVVIIASRAALKAVPPSIREAALGVGASKVQAVFHHVLPLAMPGIMTGSILAMAHALGETAPLLMIGMVAFIADIPKSFTDAATVLPVEVFMWAGRPERAWDARTSAAIIVLLVFMLLMNAIAIILRRKFERRW
jgi:phosphate transport system permease protein